MPRPLPPLTLLRAHFHFAEDGVVTLREHTHKRDDRLIGSLIGNPDKKGYLKCCFFGGTYKVHRLVFYNHHGWCPDIVDHKDRNKTNNRPDNLRPASDAQNKTNGDKRKGRATSQHRGVSWDATRQRWTSHVYLMGRRIALGRFKTESEAILARHRAAKTLYGEFTP